MANKDDFQRALDLIDKSNSILITSHVKPDGDSCGSIIAMSEWLKGLGKKIRPVLLSPVPEWYNFLFDEKPAILNEDITVEQLSSDEYADVDLIIIVDTNSYSQLPEFEDYLQQNDKPILIIDHHITADGLGTVELIDSGAAAVGLIVFDLLKYAGIALTEKIAQALFVAAATDTGWFQFSNTDSRVHRVCAELIDVGANPTKIYHKLYQNFSPERIKLMTVMFDSLELHFHGRYATQHLLQADFEQTGATYEDTENLIDECRRIRTVETAALFIELPDGHIKCSLRSRGAVDVRKIAQKYGGGGHDKAAGIKMDGPVDSAMELIYDEMAEHFAETDSK